MRALVTGSSGFIGRHFVKAFQSSHDVVEVDIANGDDCREFFYRESHVGLYDLVVHCAAVVGGRTMIDGEPLRLACEDLSIDAALFSWAMRARPGRIVYFSSAAAYPVNIQAGDEHTRLMFPKLIETMTMHGAHPDNTYGEVKRIGERLAAEANAIGIKTHVFRPFSGYGSDQALDYPFPAIIARALRHETPFTIWGDGQSSRDWVHIDDIVGAVLAVIAADHFEPVNICTGVETTFDQLATLAMVAAGHHAPIEHDMSAPQGVFRRVGDPMKLRSFYVPKVSIEEGIVRAVRAALEAPQVERMAPIVPTGGIGPNGPWGTAR